MVDSVRSVVPLALDEAVETPLMGRGILKSALSWPRAVAGAWR